MLISLRADEGRRIQLMNPVDMTPDTLHGRVRVRALRGEPWSRTVKNGGNFLIPSHHHHHRPHPKENRLTLVVIAPATHVLTSPFLLRTVLVEFLENVSVPLTCLRQASRIAFIAMWFHIEDKMTEV